MSHGQALREMGFPCRRTTRPCRTALKRGPKGKAIARVPATGGAYPRNRRKRADSKRNNLSGNHQKLILMLSSISRPPGFVVLVPNAGLLIVATGLPKLR